VTSLEPFIRYYGGKWRAAPRYPAPAFPAIVDHFAGAAGYPMRYSDRRVILVETYAELAEMWRYLIRVSPCEVRRIPYVEHIDDLPGWVPSGGRTLIGFNLSAAVATPRVSLSAGLRKLAAQGRRHCGWTDARRERVASQVGFIRHWQVIEGDYTLAPDVEATHFIDPPYNNAAGAHYKHGPSGIDYAALSSWARSRRGQVIACENVGATWLPFRPFGPCKAGPAHRVSLEAIWTND
jgi:hypothetical protein